MWSSLEGRERERERKRERAHSHREVWQYKNIHTSTRAHSWEISHVFIGARDPTNDGVDILVQWFLLLFHSPIAAMSDVTKMEDEIHQIRKHDPSQRKRCPITLTRGSDRTGPKRGEEEMGGERRGEKSEGGTGEDESCERGDDLRATSAQEERKRSATGERRSMATSQRKR